MSDPDAGPDRTNPLGPFYPAEVPPIPGNARTWVAILLAVIMLFGTVWWLVAIVV